MAIDNCPLWHARLRHPAGNVPLPEGEPCMYTYTKYLWNFRLFWNLSLRTSTFTTMSTQEGRPEPVVEVWARSEHCSSRGGRSKFFSLREWIRWFPGVSVQSIFIFIVHTILSFFCGEIVTQRPVTAAPAAAAAAAAAVHRACYNQLATTLHRYRAQQQQATPCACDRSALYCVELLWKAPEIRQPSHVLVPGISRLLLLFCFVRHKTQVQKYTATAAVKRARYNQHPCRAQQQQATPCACSRYALYSCQVTLSNLRSVTHHIYPSAGAIFGCSSYMLHVCTWLPIHARGAQPGAFEVQTVVLHCCMGWNRPDCVPCHGTSAACRQPRAGSSTYPLRSEI